MSENTKLNENTNTSNAVADMSSGYAEMAEYRNVSSGYGTEEVKKEIERRIEAGEYEGLQPIDLISYGMLQLVEETEKRHEAKRKLRKEQEKRRNKQVQESGHVEPMTDAETWARNGRLD